MGTNSAVAVTMDALEGAFHGSGWQGPTLFGALRGVSAKEAIAPPAPGRRCIWEHVLHAAYWKYNVAAILEKHVLGLTEPEGFPRSPANWPDLPDRPDEKRWKQDRKLLEQMHDRLYRAAEGIKPARLHDVPSPKHKRTLSQYLVGVAAHDAYHCGQVQLIKRLVREGTD